MRSRLADGGALAMSCSLLFVLSLLFAHAPGPASYRRHRCPQGGGRLPPRISAPAAKLSCEESAGRRRRPSFRAVGRAQIGLTRTALSPMAEIAHLFTGD